MLNRKKVAQISKVSLDGGTLPIQLISYQMLLLWKKRKESVKYKHILDGLTLCSRHAFRKIQHSCCPVAMLDAQDPSSPLGSLSWLTLHDLEEGHLNSYSALGDLEGDTRSRALELKKLFGSVFKCTCTRCL